MEFVQVQLQIKITEYVQFFQKKNKFVSSSTISKYFCLGLLHTGAAIIQISQIDRCCKI